MFFTINHSLPYRPFWFSIILAYFELYDSKTGRNCILCSVRFNFVTPAVILMNEWPHCLLPLFTTTSKVTFLFLFSVLVQWKNYPCTFLLPEHWCPPFWPQWQSITATPSDKAHRLCQSVALYRAHILTDSQPPSHIHKSLLLSWFVNKCLLPIVIPVLSQICHNIENQ